MSVNFQFKPSLPLNRFEAIRAHKIDLFWIYFSLTFCFLLNWEKLTCKLQMIFRKISYYETPGSHRF